MFEQSVGWGYKNAPCRRDHEGQGCRQDCAQSERSASLLVSWVGHILCAGTLVGAMQDATRNSIIEHGADHGRDGSLGFRFSLHVPNAAAFDAGVFRDSLAAMCGISKFTVQDGALKVTGPSTGTVAVMIQCSLKGRDRLIHKVLGLAKRTRSVDDTAGSRQIDCCLLPEGTSITALRRPLTPATPPA